MLSKTRLFMSVLIMSSTLLACSESDTTTTETTAAPVVTKSNDLQVGMTEEQVKAALGAPSIMQTRTIDELTVSHMEWTNESGITSVQLQNGKVEFIQVIPAK